MVVNQKELWKKEEHFRKKCSYKKLNPHTAGNTEHFGFLAPVMHQAYGHLKIHRKSCGKQMHSYGNIIRWRNSQIQTAYCFGWFLRLKVRSFCEITCAARLFRSLHSWRTSVEMVTESILNQCFGSVTADGVFKECFRKLLWLMYMSLAHTTELFIGFINNGIVWSLYLPKTIIHPRFGLWHLRQLAIFIHACYKWKRK